MTLLLVFAAVVASLRFGSFMAEHPERHRQVWATVFVVAAVWLAFVLVVGTLGAQGFGEGD